MSTDSKVPFETVDSHKFNRWTAIAALVLLAIVTVAVLSLTFRGNGPTSNTVNSTSTAAVNTADTEKQAADLVRTELAKVQGYSDDVTIEQMSLNDYVADMSVLYDKTAVDKVTARLTNKQEFDEFRIYLGKGPLLSRIVYLVRRPGNPHWEVLANP